MHKRHEQDYSKESKHPYSSRVLPIAVLVAGLVLSACASSEATGAKANKSAKSSARQLESTIAGRKDVNYFRGDLILVNSVGESKVVVNPIIRPKHKVTESLDTDNYDFYYLVTDSTRRGHITTTAQDIDLTGYDVELRPTTSGNAANSTSSSIITVSGKPLINSPTLFSHAPNTSINGFNTFSCDCHPVGDTYYVSTQSNQVPVGVLLEGQAIDHQ